MSIVHLNLEAFIFLEGPFLLIGLSVQYKMGHVFCLAWIVKFLLKG